MTIEDMVMATHEGRTMEEEAEITAHVAVYVGDFRLEGELHVGTGHGGERRRVSDALNSGSDFIALTNVTMTGPNTVEKKPKRHNIIIVRKGEIKFAVPMD